MYLLLLRIHLLSLTAAEPYYKSSRYRDRDDYRDRGRNRYDRSRSPLPSDSKPRIRSRSPVHSSRRGREEADPVRTARGPDAPRAPPAPDAETNGNEDPNDIDTIMRKTMGFTSFRTTQNTKVPGNDIYGVRKEKKAQYRQYMNRPGGFNRPLSPTR